MNLERITVEFHAEEDRLRVRLFFGGQAEVLLWLTRRLVKRVWPVLIQMAQGQPEIQQQTNPETRKALLGFQHEKALQAVKFTKGAQEPGRTHPLGEAPMLVCRMQARRNERGQTVLALLPREGNGIHLALSDTMLHGFLKLVQDTAAKAEWDLPLSVPTLAAAETSGELRTLAN